MKNFLVMMPTYTTMDHLNKDPLSFAYYLAKDYGWQVSYAYFGKEKIKDADLESYCCLIYLGEEKDEDREIKIGENFLRENAVQYDVLMCFNYGKPTRHWSTVAKKYHPAICVYDKLDMSAGGFSHFYDGTIWREVKNISELYKLRYVDFFTVESRLYYEKLVKTRLFRNRIGYLSNGVSMREVDERRLAEVKKENIVLTVGRLGSSSKRTDLFLEAILSLPRDLLAQWKFYFVGSMEATFAERIRSVIEDDSLLKEHVVCTGEIYDRQELYEIYAKSKIFVMPSKSESFCLATVEAMMQGCFPVCTDYGAAVYDQLDYGKMGMIISSSTVPVLSATLESVMRREHLHEREIREYAKKMFSYEMLTRKLNCYLEKCVGGTYENDKKQ